MMESLVSTPSADGATAAISHYTFGSYDLRKWMRAGDCASPRIPTSVQYLGHYDTTFQHYFQYTNFGRQWGRFSLSMDGRKLALLMYVNGSMDPLDRHPEVFKVWIFEERAGGYQKVSEMELGDVDNHFDGEEYGLDFDLSADGNMLAARARQMQAGYRIEVYDTRLGGSRLWLLPVGEMDNYFDLLWRTWNRQNRLILSMERGATEVKKRIVQLTSMYHGRTAATKY